MGKINTAPLSGMRDFLPGDVRRRRWVVGIVEEVYQAYGFEPLETPTMERLDTLLGKYGEEGDQLIFRVLKRGDKLQRVLQGKPSENELADAGLRYDLTVPLARVVAQYRTELPQIFKRYQIQPVFRADRPAKGRFREFYQCDVDIVGTAEPTAEVEILAAAAEVLRRLGFAPGTEATIRLNHRRLLRSLLEAAGVPLELEETALVAVDKLDKVGLEGVRRELEERGIPPGSITAICGWLQDLPTENGPMRERLRELLADSPPGLAALAELEAILQLSSGGPAGEALRLDPWLARGLSYYTGPIFEVQIAGFSGSAGGGGRYDRLIGMFSGEELPACGFSLGLERILLILEEKNRFPESVGRGPDLLVTLFSPELVPASLRLAWRLRAEGFRVDVYPEPARYGKQFRYAEQRGIRYALLLGPEEHSSGAVAVRDLLEGHQEAVPEGRLLDWLQQRLGSS